MKQSRRQVADLIATRSLKRGSVDKKLATEVAAYLMSEGRTQELDSLVRDVQARWADAGYLEVIATSAEALSAGTKSDIRKLVKQQYPKAQQVVITEVHDPAMIGGVRLNTPGRQLDLSVLGKLNKFKQLTQ